MESTVVKRIHLTSIDKEHHKDNQEDDELDPELKARLDRFPSNAVAKGEDFLKLHFKTARSSHDEGSMLTAPVYTHQLFLDSYHCGLVGLKVDLEIDLTCWNIKFAEETFDDKATDNEGSALERAKQQECIAPLFASDPAVDQELLKRLPGRVVWRNSDGYALKYCEQLDDISRNLLSRCLAVSTFFIERASQVDLGDPAWKLLLLVKGRPEIDEEVDLEKDVRDEILIGFTSLYEFRNPIKDTRSFRVCVMLVLPFFQRKKFGDIMLSTVYREASNHADITEVTVEDPCEAFSRMRRRLDLANCKRKRIFFAMDISAFEQMPKLSKELLSKYQKELRLTEKQLQFCYECAWLDRLKELKEDDEDSARKTKLRLAIKARINKDPGDLVIPDKQNYPDEFKQVLNEAYLTDLRAMEDTLSAVGNVQFW